MPDPSASLLGPKKILAVDDSLTFLSEIGDSLRSEGYDVVPSRSGEEALELLAVQPVDCILLDLMMPGLGGQETCRRIKAAPTLRDTPLILLTSLDDRDAMLQGLSAGADDYVVKSGELDVLKARVRAQMRRKQFEDENRRMRNELVRHELDVTEARAARALAETRALLLADIEAKNRELEAFSYSVSHDLRAPLRAINGFSREILDSYAENMPVRGRFYLDRIVANSKRMGQLIDDLLELSSITRRELVRVPCDLAAFARGIVEELRNRQPDRVVEIVIAESLPVIGDAGLLRAALENLIGNAWKFTGKQAAASIEVGSQPNGHGPVYFVKDNGAGFDMALAGKLFAPFQRLHSSEEFEGTGIGLSTIQRIVSRHGGKIWTESERGRGATFFFTLGRH
jgi:signal transduction histidine kinase